MTNLQQPENSVNSAGRDVQSRYVAFCDILGFSASVESDFDATLMLYETFAERLREWPFPERVQVTTYSDSVLIVCDELPPILHAVQSLWFATLTQDWLIRGGIAYGKYWETKRDGNFFVVSDALIRAVRLESTIKIPAVVLSPEVDPTLSAWVSRFQHGPFNTPLLHFRGTSLVNPFNRYWFASASMRVAQLAGKFPEHSSKYEWFLDLFHAVQQDETLVPASALQELLDLGILAERSAPLA